jgi:glycosyltransferase involved in cell wall biosynthesis
MKHTGAFDAGTPLVSVIVPTRNSDPHLVRCLTSIRAQTYPSIELIVVDSYSTDMTRDIASLYADKILLRGGERSSQVNYGVAQARGEFVYKVDSDFALENTVVQQCVEKTFAGYDTVVVHNSPDTSAGWLSKIRAFEVSMYKYNLDHSSARFMKRSIYQALGGYDEDIIAGEDYDIQNRIRRAGYTTGFADAEAIHLGEPRTLRHLLGKYYAYGWDFHNYVQKNVKESRLQLGFTRRVYFKNWRRFVSSPALGAAFFIYHCLKFVSAGMGYVVGWLDRRCRTLATLDS